MSGLEMVTRACSTFHADTACPSCKIKLVHDALCRDQNSQAVRSIFYSHFVSVPNWPRPPFISRLILARAVTFKRDKASSIVDIVIFRCMPRNTADA